MRSLSLQKGTSIDIQVNQQKSVVTTNLASFFSTDGCGSMQAGSLLGSRCFVTFKDRVLSTDQFSVFDTSMVYSNAIGHLNALYVINLIGP